MTKLNKFIAFVVFPLLFLSLVILTLFVGSALEVSHTHRTGHHVNPTGRLTVDIEFGTIKIETTEDQHHINITTRKKWKSRGIQQLKSHKQIDALLKDFEITTESGDSDVQIEGRFTQGREQWREELKRLTVEVQVTIPRQYNVTLKTVSHGDIHVGNIDGAVRAEALDGNLYLGEIQGDVLGKTGTHGAITLKGCQGDVDLTAARGDIQAEMTTQPQYPWTLYTSGNGRIDAMLSPDIAVDVDAQTQGIISSDFPIQWQDDIGSSRLKGTVNGGGPLLKLRSAAGEIHVKRK